ncbi:uncharacterized protein LOC130736849 [Lotus japonicus]|uniref:uncharacterized protein LOC130736849 n=1 Tax=Lotus japonicus TaxID=34305 RepID=UPI00258CD78E|nr:uncharacterized protein LOC130736849 [Lotus japonicus]
MVGGEERNGGWSDIQQELLEEILRKLTLVDYLKCRRVCRSWRRIVDDAVATKGTCPPAPQFPFLMLLPKSLGSATLIDITQEDTSYTIAPPGTWKHGYIDGVFLVQGCMAFRKFYYHKNQCYDLVWFSNPVSGEEFELPHLPLFSGQIVTDVSVKLVFSSTPDSSDFLVVACARILSYHPNNRRKQQLAFCKVADKSWTIILTDEYGPTYFNQFVILDWKLYAMTSRVSDNSVTVFNLRDSNIITSERLVMLNPNAIPKESHVEVKDGVQYYTKSEVCMTRDGDELLLVLHLTEHVMDTSFWDTLYFRTKGFRIFKLDICGPRWIEIDDLSDRVLLIDEIGIQVISANEISLPIKLSQGNCVFFSSLNIYTRECDLGVFSLKDKSMKPLSLHPSSKNCLWFIPSLW